MKQETSKRSPLTAPLNKASALGPLLCHLSEGLSSKLSLRLGEFIPQAELSRIKAIFATMLKAEITRRCHEIFAQRGED